MVTSPPPTIAVILRRAGAIAVAAVLLVAPVLAPSAWHDVPSALAASGGNGKGNNGNGNGNGGSTGAQEDNGSAAKAKKDKHEKDNSTGESDADEGDASAGQGAASEADQPASSSAPTQRPGPVHVAAEHSGHDFVPGEIVVANMGAKTKLAARRLGFVLLDERRFPTLKLTLARLRTPRGMTAPAARRQLASRFPGIAVDLNALYRPEGTLVLPPPDYPGKLIGWGPVPVSCGRGLRLGLLDTAVDTTLPGLHGANIVQRSFLAPDSAAASSEHGSAIAWLLVGRRLGRSGGLLPGAELAAAGVFRADPDGAPIADVMALISGLDWLASRRTPVINMSFAGERNAVVALALRNAIARHIVVVAAAGNGGASSGPAFPAAEAGVIAVTAVDSGAQPYPDANQGNYIAFAAPGVRVWTAARAPTGSYQSGTSFAAPFVTAAVGVRLADGAGPDAAEITRILAKTARDLGPPGRDPIFGWGLLQAASPCSTLNANRAE